MRVRYILPNAAVDTAREHCRHDDAAHTQADEQYYYHGRSNAAAALPAARALRLGAYLTPPLYARSRQLNIFAYAEDGFHYILDCFLEIRHHLIFFHFYERTSNISTASRPMECLYNAVTSLIFADMKKAPHLRQNAHEERKS